MADITYTHTDEAPALATRSLLPILEAIGQASGIRFKTYDISLAGRILEVFSDRLSQPSDLGKGLASLSKMVEEPTANIIKLPNISASVPQLMAAIKELQEQGWKVPDYPAYPKTDEEREVKKRYGVVLGSAVNPVLREGNSDRRVAGAVKQYAKEHPHKVGAWAKNSRSQVLHMQSGDFFESEQSLVVAKDARCTIVLKKKDGGEQPLKEMLRLNAGTIVDGARLQVVELKKFYGDSIKRAKEEQLLLSLHLKATMMKVSDPIIFGHAVEIYFQELIEKHGELLKKIGFSPRHGVAALEQKFADLSEPDQAKLKTALASVYEDQPDLAMVDSDQGITNLHVPSDIIIDASMPAAIRNSGQMWGPDGRAFDTLFMIPDRSYARIYQTVIDDCKKNGAFDVQTMGSVANVGLMAKKAEEYGSHDKTFEIDASGQVEVRLEGQDKPIMVHQVERGDIWRMCSTQEVAVDDWVRLAAQRAKAAGSPTIFWLDEQRAHDRILKERVEKLLNTESISTEGADIEVLSPTKAMAKTLRLVRQGTDVISVTGNVLRDYLTDLFPILELGTSAKMLSIVPLLGGGGLYETGAGGSAPKHVQQLVAENHLRWDSLGEFLAVQVAFEDLARKTEDIKVKVMSETLGNAISRWLRDDRSPGRRVGTLDNRGSHVYLAHYWLDELSTQSEDEALSNHFKPFVAQLKDRLDIILKEVADGAGSSVELGGYYHPDPSKAEAVMRPSQTFNQLLEAMVEKS